MKCEEKGILMSSLSYLNCQFQLAFQVNLKSKAGGDRVFVYTPKDLGKKDV
jgi:hypothetical protein